MTAALGRGLAIAAIAGLCLGARPRAALCGAPDGQLAASCASCHRADGHDTGIPPIAGLDEGRIVQLMLAYRSGARADQMMQVIARALSPEEIAAIAHYVGGRRAAGQQAAGQ